MESTSLEGLFSSTVGTLDTTKSGFKWVNTDTVKWINTNKQQPGKNK